VHLLPLCLLNPQRGSHFNPDENTRVRSNPEAEHLFSMYIHCILPRKTGREHDYTAIALWGEAANGWYLLDLVWGRWEFPALVERITVTWDRWRSGPAGLRPTTLVVEDASSGTAIIQTIQTQTRIPIVPYRADRDKVSRAYAVSNLLAAAKLFLAASDAEGVGEFSVQGFIDEHTVFPRGMHDDRVDTTTMALLYLSIAPTTPAMPAYTRESFAGKVVHIPQQRRAPRRVW